MRIIVVRHGLAVPKKRWSGPDDERPLVARGRRQAERLAKVVGAGRPDRVLSSPALRCRQTVQPLADRHGVEVEIADGLSTDAGAAAAALVHKLAESGPPGSVFLLCTHREVLVDLVPAMVAEAGRGSARHLPGAKGGAWILRFDEPSGEAATPGRLKSIGYRPPAA